MPAATIQKPAKPLVSRVWHGLCYGVGMETRSPLYALRRLGSVDRAVLASVLAMAGFNLLVTASHLLAVAP
jgi:hypothetical protein